MNMTAPGAYHVLRVFLITEIVSPFATKKVYARLIQLYMDNFNKQIMIRLLLS